jgi:hypothetical protein
LNKTVIDAKKIFSYLLPIKIHTKSMVSKSIEITWTNGELVLIQKTLIIPMAVYILRLGLKSIGFDKIIKMNHVLILGVAGGV